MLAKLENVNLTFLPNTDLEVKALKNITFNLGMNESVGVIGASGSSKSTFAQVLAALMKPDNGSVFVNDIDIYKKRAKRLHNYISYLFQNPEKQLFENTVFDEVAFSLRNIGLKEVDVIGRVEGSLDDVGLDYEKYKYQSPFNLSGGEMRRIGIASILALDSMAFVLDEPTVGLDQKSKKLVIELLLKIKKKKTIVLVSHDIEEVLRVCDRVVVFQQGEIVLECQVQDINKYVSLLNELKIKMPPEYILGLKLEECGLSISDFSSSSISELIEKRQNGR